MPDERSHRRSRAFALLAAICVLGGGTYVALAATRDSGTSGSDPSAPAEASVARALAAPSGATRVLFQHVARDGDYAHLALADAERPSSRTTTELTCERAHFGGGRGLCLVSRQGLTGPAYTAKVFGPDLQVRRQLRLGGLLSRARVSPDGRLGAVTSFVLGHSYADPGEFSTSTVLIDMASGRRVADLEDFVVTRERQRIQAADVNFWGVTFARDSDRFYATLRTGGRTYLIEGDVSDRRARVLRENVECPSLSPDGTRVVYKKRVDEGSVIWRLHVLDLATMTETALAEPQMVDDQAEWLDDQHVLYGLDGDVWVVPSDGSGAPRRLLADALSPAVIRSSDVASR